jgi:NTP pyrophosphatase (non-canonical NTP hydrolase)
MNYPPDVLLAVHEERKRQDAKWGQQNHSPIEWIAILTEEVGEAAKEAVEMHFAKDFPTHYPDDVERAERYHAELIQVAAVAVAMIESLDRNKPK